MTAKTPTKVPAAVVGLCPVPGMARLGSMFDLVVVRAVNVKTCT